MDQLKPDQLVIDLGALRGSGYLPEAVKDREFADQYRQIKRPLIKRAFAGKGTGNAAGAAPGAIMVTSPLPGDGKTFTSINLAFSLARERDTSVLLVDADLLKPHVSRIFGVAERAGLTDALMDDGLAVESLVVRTNMRGFSLLPAGRLRDGTAELMSSERMIQVMKSLCQHDPRRIVLLDSPPLLITSEGRILLSVVSQAVLVVRAGVTPRQAMLDSIALFHERQGGGIVLNDARVGAIHGYHGYGNYGDAGSPTI